MIFSRRKHIFVGFSVAMVVMFLIDRHVPWQSVSWQSPSCFVSSIKNAKTKSEIAQISKKNPFREFQEFSKDSKNSNSVVIFLREDFTSVELETILSYVGNLGSFPIGASSFARLGYDSDSFLPAIQVSLPPCFSKREFVNLRDLNEFRSVYSIWPYYCLKKRGWCDEKTDLVSML